MTDSLDRMLFEIGAARTPEVPLALTTLEAFHARIDAMPTEEFHALVATGYAAAIDGEGAWPVPAGAPALWPQHCPPEVLRMIEEGVDFKDVRPEGVSEEDWIVLAIVGLWTLVAERFIAADANN